ncbi:MAG: hydroxymyristoyl-ACP dehydratase [Betaproteobacteria bacterium]
MIPALPIERMLPHAGAMVLVDEIVYADSMRIECATRAHLRPGFPLAAEGRISSLCGIEIAAQAMALHAAAADPAHRPRAGRLASVSDVELLHDRLDDAPTPLRVEATLEVASGRGSAYRFVVSAAGRILVRGRALVMRVDDA